MTLSVRMLLCFGGKLNITEKLPDRHIATRGDQTIPYFGKPTAPNKANLSYTYRQLLAAVNKCANAPKRNGCRRRPRVFTCPWFRRVTIAILACAGFGAIPFQWYCRVFSNSLVQNNQRCSLAKWWTVQIIIPRGAKHTCQSCGRWCNGNGLWICWKSALVHKTAGDTVNFSKKPMCGGTTL